ncbi:MAG: hypothetical protein Kow0031_10260 [Anaerolineae bacterium]
MAIKIDLIRPDDLLNLRIEADNLRLDPETPEEPALVVEDSRQPAYLIVTFPPQTIAEGAYFEFSIVKPEGNPARPDTDKSNEPLDNPGQPQPPRHTAAQLSRPSRLVFKVPAEARIPFSTAGLLDWSKLELNVSPIAAIGSTPRPEEIAAAPAITQPAPNETSLELPYRLLISPNRNVLWNHRAGPFTSHGRTELWHTRLQLKTPDGPVELSREHPAPLRAIWSPDYKPGNPPQPSDKDPDLNRTAMSANDRYQLVILTSAFHGYEVDVDFNLIQAPLNPALNPRVFAQAARFTRLKITQPYVPEPFEAEQLMLSPLGGWLHSRGHWSPPRTAKPVVNPPRPDFKDIFARLPLVQPRGRQLTPNLAAPASDLIFLPGLFVTPPAEQLDLSEWVHVATQGRDHYVRIVYEGELWPFRHRAALIKVTERKFMEHNGIVGAYLMQRMFIVVRQPEKQFNDRGNPFRRVRLTTLVTPDIADPDSALIPGTKRSFWVKVMTGAPLPALFRFHAIGTDVAGNAVDFTVPLMFVSISDLPEASAAAAKAVATEYNAKSNIAARSASVPGQKVTFAAHDPAQPNDNTRLVTQTLNFVVDAAGNPPQMLKAEVKIPQVQELLGTDTPTTIRFFKNYVAAGFDAATGVFAEIVKEDLSQFKPDDPFAAMVADTLGVNFSSDKAGGFATPNLGVSTLSRALGPLAGKVEDAVLDSFEPDKFFKKGLAQLFGSFDLVDLLPKTSLGQNAPKLRTQTQDIAGGKLLIATLDWEPKVVNLQVPPSGFAVARFEKDRNGRQSKLLIHGRIEKPLKLDSLGAPPADGVKSEFTGKLNDFRVGVLESVFINFVEFSFDTRTNQKPDVKVKLDPATPIEFAGDLKFVEELRKAIPPDLFGKGPSLDIAPTGIRAGFAFALPPLAVGVFALKDVSLGAALTLPFLDGKPVFDFNVSERPHPFLLAVGIFGGGGFFRLQLDTAGIKQLEASFEFGATAALDIGVASGEVHIMAGIYFSMQRKENSTDLACVLSGYLRMGGSLSVLGLIKVSVEFNLSFTYDGVKDKAYGRATLTVHVEVLFFSTSVELTVERAFGGKSGDPKFGELFNTAETWSQYALAFAQ